jgi:hypothetical protein
MDEEFLTLLFTNWLICGTDSSPAPVKTIGFYLQDSSYLESSNISMSFSSLRWFESSSFYRSYLLLFSSSRTMLMLSTSLWENWSGWWLDF